MANVTLQSEIEKYDLKDDTIELHHSNPWEKENRIYTLSKRGFENWLMANNKLTSYIEVDGDMIPGNITIAEYWENTSYLIKHDDMKSYMIVMEKKELANSAKMTRSSLVDQIAAVTNNEFAANMLEQIQHLEECARNFQMLETVPAKELHIETFGKATV